MMHHPKQEIIVSNELKDKKNMNLFSSLSLDNISKETKTVVYVTF